MEANNSAARAISLDKDHDFIHAVWFTSQEEVMEHMDRMLHDGWTWTQDGLTSVGDDGPVIARPVKKVGEKRYSGIGVWKHDNPSDQ